MHTDTASDTAATRPSALHLSRGRHGVLLFHGLSSAPQELIFLARGLHRAGYTVRLPVIEGYTHGLGEPGRPGATEWLEAARAELDVLRAECDHVTVGGLCVGAVLALCLAADCADRIAGFMGLSTALHYDGWGNPWYTRLLPLANWLPGAGRIRIAEGEPFGLKDTRMRAWVARQMQQAGASDAGAASLQVRALVQARRLTREARAALPDVRCPVLLVHAKEDENASPRSAYEVASRVRSPRVWVSLLQDSYHMISIDQEKATVLQDMRRFLEADPPAVSLSGLRPASQAWPFLQPRTGSRP